jgi:ribosomal protein S4E
MDVIQVEKTGENFRLVYDVKGRSVPSSGHSLK